MNVVNQLSEVCDAPNGYAQLINKLNAENIDDQKVVVDLLENNQSCYRKVKNTKRDLSKPISKEAGLLNLALAKVDRKNDPEYISQAETIWKNSIDIEKLKSQVNEESVKVRLAEEETRKREVQNAQKSFNTYIRGKSPDEAELDIPKKRELQDSVLTKPSKQTLQKVKTVLIDKTPMIFEIIVYSIFMILFAVLAILSLYWYSKEVNDEEEYDYVSNRKNLWLAVSIASAFLVLVLIGLLIYAIIRLVKAVRSQK